MARTFNGTSQYLRRTSAVVTGVPLTVAAWCRPASFGGPNHQTVIALTGGAINAFWLRQGVTTGAVGAVIGDGVAAAASSAGSMTVGQWNHAAGVYALSTSRTAYTNGVAGTPDTTAITPTAIAETLVGNRHTTASEFYNGDLAEVGIWNVALTATEIAALAAGLAPLVIRPDALVAYYPLHGYASPDIDWRGGRDLTLTGAPPAATHCRIQTTVGVAITLRALAPYHIAGFTRDQAGNIVAGVTVKLYRTSDDVLVGTTTSNALGAYSFTVYLTTTQYYLVAYKAGIPDTAGTSVNTLVGVI